MNAFDEMRAAMNEAEERIRAADSVSTQMAQMLRGRLRKVKYPHLLRDLKRELRDFDMTTGRWKK